MGDKKQLVRCESCGNRVKQFKLKHHKMVCTGTKKTKAKLRAATAAK